MNQQEKILTIVVPSYNTEKYINTCIPTMLNHQMCGQLEILLVNDGSCDHTLSKLLRYEQAYPDTVRVIDKTNGGHGSVINIGIRQARGKYFKVVDGDDWVISRNLERLICCLNQGTYDLVVNPYIKLNVNTGRRKTVSFHGRKYRRLDFDSAACLLSEIEIHAATYRTGLLRKNHITVRENCFYEDTQYNIYPIRYVKSIYLLDFAVCVYRNGTKDQSIYPEKAYENRFMHKAVVMDCCNYYMKNKDISLPKRMYIERIIRRRILSQYLLYMKNRDTYAGNSIRRFCCIDRRADYKELLEWDRELKESFPYFYKKTNYFPISWLRTRRMSVYRMIYRMYFLIQLLKKGALL